MERSIHVPDDKRPSDDLVGRDDQVLAQVNKGSGETEGGVDESSGMTAEDREQSNADIVSFSHIHDVRVLPGRGPRKLTRNLSWKGTWSTFLPRPT